jgi:hypothetical protein
VVDTPGGVPDISSLPLEPPAGPTVMQQTHANAMRKGVALVKAHLKDPEEAEDFLRVAVLGYLEEWAQTYYRGSREAANGNDRTLLMIRMDTVQQMTAELGTKVGKNAT